ncbi:MAG: alpha/beta hydrolase [Phototrophicaceae bacterium]
MKVTKDMVHEDLRGFYFPMKILGGILSQTWGMKLMNRANERLKGDNIEGLQCQEMYIPSTHGDPDIRIRIYKPLDAPDNLPCMLYLHGGGYVLGVPEAYPDIIKKFIDAKPCIIVAPDYRKALATPYPAAFNDCYDTLLWANDHADELGAIADKFIVCGHSAGGGLAAAVTLKASDTNDVNIAFQMPIYPMIDDRQMSASSQSNAPVWNAKSNKLAWHLYLKQLKETDSDIPAYAAPARANNYSHLPPTITFVGSLEPFRDETIAYVEHIRQEGIPVAFELYEGCFHAFEVTAPATAIGHSAWDFLLSNYSAFVDKYIYNTAVSISQTTE